MIRIQCSGPLFLGHPVKHCTWAALALGKVKQQDADSPFFRGNAIFFSLSTFTNFSDRPDTGKWQRCFKSFDPIYTFEILRNTRKNMVRSVDQLFYHN